MLKKLLWLTVLWILLVAPAAAQGQGTIAGQVTNGTLGGPVTDLPVTLHIFQGMQEAGTKETTTDAEGRFQFSDLDEEAFYFVTVVYQDIEYPSGLLRFKEGQTELDVPLTVYEPGTDDTALHIERAHLIVDFEPGALVIGEMLVLVNESDRVYVGAESQEQDLRPVVYIDLPADAQDLQLDGGELGQRFVQTAEGFADTNPVLPGANQLIYSYRLPVSEEAADYTLERTFPYPVAHLNVLVADVGTHLHSEQVAFQGSVGAQGQRYLNYTGSNLAAGTRLTLELVGLPKEFGREAGFAAPRPVTRQDRQRPIAWLGVGLAVLGVGLALSYPRWRPH